MSVSLPACLSVCMSMCVCVRLYMCLCVSAYASVCLYVCQCACVHSYAKCSHLSTCVHDCACVRMQYFSAPVLDCCNSVAGHDDVLDVWASHRVAVTTSVHLTLFHKAEAQLTPGPRNLNISKLICRHCHPRCHGPRSGSSSARPVLNGSSDSSSATPVLRSTLSKR